MNTKQDIKEALIRKLANIQSLVNAGNAREADYQLSDVIDDILSNRVKVTLTRTADNSRPGDCENSNELAARNID